MQTADIEQHDQKISAGGAFMEQNYGVPVQYVYYVVLVVHDDDDECVCLCVCA